MVIGDEPEDKERLPCIIPDFQNLSSVGFSVNDYEVEIDERLNGQLENGENQTHHTI